MANTSEARNNFERWYGNPLCELMKDEHAGFPIVMVAFPLLERLLKARCSNKPNTPPFNQVLLLVLPELKNESHANLFWSIYRHGILHDVALSRESHGLRREGPIVEVLDNGEVWLHPYLFAQRVLEAIRADFPSFERGVPLPQVGPVVDLKPPGITWFVGTNMPPRSGK